MKHILIKEGVIYMLKIEIEKTKLDTIVGTLRAVTNLIGPNNSVSEIEEIINDLQAQIPKE